MSMTIGFVLRYDQAPAAPVPPSVVPPTVIHGHGYSPAKVAAPIQREGASFSWQSSTDGFPAYASTTYGSRGEPNRPWVPSQTRLDLYA